MRTRDERHDYEAALRRLPEAHSLALRLRDSGAPDDVICEYFREIQPRNETQQKFLVVSLNNLDKMSAERTERVTVARTDTGPPWSLWVVQFITSAMVLGYAIVFGGKSSTVHYAMVAALGVLVATILFLMVELSHPYPGGMSTSPEPLGDVIDFLSAPAA